MEKINYNKFYVNTLDESTGVCENKENTMLLVVDIQPRLMASMENADLGIKNTLALEEVFRKYSMPILATEQYPKGLGRLDERVLEHIDEDKVFEKTIFDAYTPEVADYIEKNAISNVVVVGAEGHICVYQTVRSLRSAGLNVFLVEDAVNSFKESQKETAIKGMREMGTVIVNTEMLLFDIAQDAKDEYFKFVSNIIKNLRK